MATDPKLVNAEETSALAILLEPFKHQVQILQDYTYLAGRAIASLFSPPLYVNDLLQQMDIIGIGSLPIVLLTGAFIGAVMVLQTASQFERFGETALNGDIVSLRPGAGSWDQQSRACWSRAQCLRHRFRTRLDVGHRAG